MADIRPVDTMPMWAKLAEVVPLVDRLPRLCQAHQGGVGAPAAAEMLSWARDAWPDVPPAADGEEHEPPGAGLYEDPDELVLELLREVGDVAECLLSFRAQRSWPRPAPAWSNASNAICARWPNPDLSRSGGGSHAPPPRSPCPAARRRRGAIGSDGVPATLVERGGSNGTALEEGGVQSRRSSPCIGRCLQGASPNRGRSAATGPRSRGHPSRAVWATGTTRQTALPRPLPRSRKMAEPRRPRGGSSTGEERRGGEPTLKVRLREVSAAEAAERRERQIAALARLIREAAIRRRDRRRRRPR